MEEAAKAEYMSAGLDNLITIDALLEASSELACTNLLLIN